MDKVFENILRIGTVSAVEGKKVRTRYDDTNTISGWLHVLQHIGASVSIPADGEHLHGLPEGGNSEMQTAHDHVGSSVEGWLPKIGDVVLVIYLPIADGDGFVIGGL